MFVALSTGLDLESPRRHISSHVCEGVSRISREGKAYSKCGQHSPVEGGRPSLNIEEEVS